MSGRSCVEGVIQSSVLAHVTLNLEQTRFILLPKCVICDIIHFDLGGGLLEHYYLIPMRDGAHCVVLLS